MSPASELFVRPKNLPIVAITEILIGLPLNRGREEMNRTVGEDKLSAIARVSAKRAVIVYRWPTENLGADIRTGFFYCIGRRIELAGPDSLVGPAGIGFPLFDFLPGFRLCSRTRFRFGHLTFASFL